MCVGYTWSKTNIVKVSSCDEVIHGLNQYICWCYNFKIQSSNSKEFMFFHGRQLYCHFQRFYWYRCIPYPKFPPGTGSFAPSHKWLQQFFFCVFWPVVIIMAAWIRFNKLIIKLNRQSSIHDSSSTALLWVLQTTCPPAHGQNAEDGGMVLEAHEQVGSLTEIWTRSLSQCSLNLRAGFYSPLSVVTGNLSDNTSASLSPTQMHYVANGVQFNTYMDTHMLYYAGSHACA